MSAENERARDALNAIDAGLPREAWIRLGMAAKDAGLSLEDFTEWSAGAANFKGERDCATVWRSFTDGPIKAATLFAEALAAGWRDPERKNGAHRPHGAGEASEHYSAEKAAPRPDLAALWASWPAAPADFEYLIRKGMPADGLRLAPSGVTIAGTDCTGWLAVPIWNIAAGDLQGVQLIAMAGRKLTLPKSKITGNCFVWHPAAPDGRPTPEAFATGPAYVAEGVATASTIFQAMNRPGLATFGKGNLAAAAEALRKRFANLEIVLCPDRGGEGRAAEIARNIGGGWCELPEHWPANSDLNDVAAADPDGDKVRRILADVKRPAPDPERSAPVAITLDEWNTARPTPDCIVESFLFADVKETAAPGGMGKTTLKLFEAVHIVLNIPLYGREIRRPGPVALFTAEDPREILVARLRAIAEAMHLTPGQQLVVRERILIKDVSGLGFKLTEIIGDVVLPSTKVDVLIASLREVRPVLVVIDPLVSFGTGESRVNDSEQGLVEAARRIRNALNCCVELIHHSGKQNARDRAVDQYAGRNGSALPDGCRMVAVLAPVTADEWLSETGQDLGEGENAIRLALPKLSYCPPQPDILIRRRGYLFEHVQPSTTGKQAAVAANADMLHRLLASELAAGRRHSRNTLEHQAELKRSDLRAALDWLEACGRVEWRANPAGGQGGRRHYLHPVASPSGDGEPSAKGAL